jgi:membrane-bound lytic murein transglycosylase B
MLPSLRKILIGFGTAFTIATVSASPAWSDAGFQKWISDFYSVAAKNGISKKTYNAVFAGVSEPDQLVLDRAGFQPEFNSHIWDYLDARVTKFTVSTGQEMRRKYAKVLNLIESRYGVDQDILLAIWSIETIYGEYLKRPDAVHHIGQALATLAYSDKRRAKYARTQLIAALKIVQNGDITADQLVGSWAGAMGHTQFIPTSYQAWAVDIDGNGKRDVWNSPADALASAANLLKKNGWIPGQTWGYEVELPKGFNTSIANKNGYTIRDFQKMGAKRPNGKPFANLSSNAVLKFPGGTDGPAFLMMRNFYVLKNYNNADKYALAVGHLADRIAGGGPIVQNWPRGYIPLNDDERMEAQKHLLRLGFYDGEIDGNIGSGSRKAILEFQKSKGMKADGFPSRSVLDKLRVS